MLTSTFSASFRSGTMVADGYKTRMAALLFATSHLEYCSFGNKLKLPLVALQRQQNIDPYLRQLHALFSQQQDFIGFFIGATLAEFSAIETVSHYRDEMRPMDDAYDSFIAAHCAPGDFLVSSLAVEERHRGLGFLNLLLTEIGRLARARGSRRIVLTVWERNTALSIYLKKGYRIVATFDHAYPLFFEYLYLLEYELPSTAIGS